MIIGARLGPSCTVKNEKISHVSHVPDAILRIKFTRIKLYIYMSPLNPLNVIVECNTNTTYIQYIL